MKGAFLKSIFIVLTVSVLMLGAGSTYALELDIQGDKITIQADQIPLRALLYHIWKTGVIVRIDPDINPVISAKFEKRDLEKALKSIFRPYNYILIWDSVQDPKSSANQTVLSEIHIFHPGQKERMEVLEKPQKAVGKPIQTAKKQDKSSTETPVQPIDAESSDENQPTDMSARTDIIVKNDKIFVPVVLGYDDSTLTVNLILDTGASNIVLHSNIAEQLGVEEYKDSRSFGVGGIEIDTKTTALDYVKLGPHTKTDVRIDIVEYKKTTEFDYNGLLGMNFLKDLKFNLDIQNKVIEWKK